MRNTIAFKLIYFSVFILSSFCLKAQTKDQTQQFAILCKTWGLLKYYHPGVATGKQDWDSVLVTALARLSKSSNQQQLNKEVQQMMVIAGENTAKAYSPLAKENINVRNLDHNWLKDNMLTLAHQKALTFITEHPYSGLNYYAQPNPQNDSTVYTPNEKPYPEMLLPNVNYRLLSLFRFWNVINYFYPYKYTIGKPWGKVLEEMIPEMIKANDTLSYHKSLAKMAASINDSHGGLWPQVFDTITGKYSPSFDFRIIDKVAIVTRIDSADRLSKLRMGSVIEKIDGIELYQKMQAYWDYIPASNNGGKTKSLHYILLNSNKQTAMLSGYHPDGERFELIVDLKKRDLLKGYHNFFGMESPITYKMLADSVGYVFFSNINRKNLDSIMLSLMQTKAIIFDMRNYPANGSGTYLVPEYLLKAPQYYSRLTRPDFSLPGTFIYEVANKETAYAQVGKHNPNPYKGKIILLVDNRTQSAAEWACMTLKTADNVTVIGDQTAGADGNVTRTILPGGYRINFSGLGIYYPNGTETQRIGIKVDVPVTYTVLDIVNQQDPC
ncbi:S41 family peptidase [Pedobacter sp. UC225_65]|uniref:S41 family peptidase n=1 Tax=Pedobacter sp. UC225_65 TaxID=3350173 RepID=UPI003672EBCA